MGPTTDQRSACRRLQNERLAPPAASVAPPLGNPPGQDNFFRAGHVLRGRLALRCQLRAWGVQSRKGRRALATATGSGRAPMSGETASSNRRP
eukprot:6186286-Pleurochrysis_carterae.AAC.4